jgi:hypothetical protein
MNPTRRKKAMKKIETFPKEIFVVREKPENDDPYLLIHETADSVAVPNEKIKVAVYRFVGMATVSAPVHVD